MTYYDIEAGPLGEALELAIGSSMLRPPAHERIFATPGLVDVDWDRARHCHHTNMPLVVAIGGMIDPVAAEAALGPKYRLVERQRRSGRVERKKAKSQMRSCTPLVWPNDRYDWCCITVHRAPRWSPDIPIRLVAGD